MNAGMFLEELTRDELLFHRSGAILIWTGRQYVELTGLRLGEALEPHAPEMN
jgi:hypothetical protein